MSKSKFSDALAAATKDKTAVHDQTVARLEILASKHLDAYEDASNASTDITARRRPGRPAGKRSDPDYQPTTAYIRKATYRSVRRALMDESDLGEKEREYSELVEELLKSWLTTKI